MGDGGSPRQCDPTEAIGMGHGDGLRPHEGCYFFAFCSFSAAFFAW